METWVDVLKFIIIPIFPILIYKTKTRNELVLKQKSPFIIDLYVSLDELHQKLRIYSKNDGNSFQEKEERLLEGFPELIKKVQNNIASSRLYLSSKTNFYLDEYISDCIELVESVSNYHESNIDNVKKTELLTKWSKDLPEKLKNSFNNKITPALKVELNGYLGFLLMKSNSPP